MQDPALDRLSGWKEIAQYLRRSVRSVQRWERELNLPVQRVKTKNGHVVFASRHELDQWLSRMDVLPDDDAEPVEPAGPVALGDPAGAEPLDPVAPAMAPARRWWPIAIATMAFAAVTIAIVAFTARTRDAAPPRPLDVKLVDSRLEARDGAGAVVWMHDFGGPVSQPFTNLRGLREDSDSIAGVDLNSDGTEEYLVPVRVGLEALGPVFDALYAFDGNGRVLWSVRPDTMLTCGGEVFRPPWRLSAAIVSRESRPLRVWAAFHHHTWWPSFVLEIGPDGTAAMRYVQAGWVRALAEWPTVAGTMLAAGGVINEWGRASVAVVDVAGPPALLPADEASFRCDVPGAVPPRLVTLFPEHEVSRAAGHAYVMVHGLVRQGPDLRVEINGIQAIAMLEPDAGVTSLRMGDDYWPAHDALTRAGALDHLARECPERTQPRELRTWTRDGWRTTRLGQPSDPGTAPGR